VNARQTSRTHRSLRRTVLISFRVSDASTHINYHACTVHATSCYSATLNLPSTPVRRAAAELRTALPAAPHAFGNHEKRPAQVTNVTTRRSVLISLPAHTSPRKMSQAPQDILKIKEPLQAASQVEVAAGSRCPTRQKRMAPRKRGRR